MDKKVTKGIQLFFGPETFLPDMDHLGADLTREEKKSLILARLDLLLDLGEERVDVRSFNLPPMEVLELIQEMMAEAKSEREATRH